MIETQKFNFIPTRYTDKVIIHKDGMKIEVEVSYSSLVSLIHELEFKDRHELMMRMRSM